MTTDNPTSPKGSGGPRLDDFTLNWLAEELDDRARSHETSQVSPDAIESDSVEFYKGAARFARAMAGFCRTCPRGDESGPAPPTDGPRCRTCHRTIVGSMHSIAPWWCSEECRDADGQYQRAERLEAALAESRAEVERANRDRESAYQHSQAAFAAVRGRDETIATLRDRVRALETAARKALGAVSIERIHGLLSAALSTTQEPPAKEPTP